MSDNLMPAELASIISTHRSLFGGFTMMANETPAGETPAQEPTTPPAQAPVPKPPPTPPAAPAEPPAEDLTDWKAEARKWEDRSKANQQQAKSQLDAIAQALGLKEQQATPEQLAQQLTTEQTNARMAKVQLAVYRTAGEADPDKLLDSSTFIESLKDVDPSDTEAVKAKVKEAVDKAPWLRRTGGSNGDLHQGHGTPPAQANLNDLLRAAAGRR